MSTSVLADRLRKLEAAEVVERVPGPSGSVVEYRLTETGRGLAPAMAALRAWGVRYLYTPAFGRGPDPDEECFDVSFVEGHEALSPESYEWRIDHEVVTLEYSDGRICRLEGSGAGAPAALVATTNSDFMRRWAEGSTDWDQGRADGEVIVEGDDSAWTRMQVATGYLNSNASVG